jgi:D-amino-acid dehydrogenase
MTRVAVVGAGVAGAATAYWLARGGADVIVADSGDPGGATAAGAGIVQPWSSATRWRSSSSRAAATPT